MKKSVIITGLVLSIALFMFLSACSQGQTPAAKPAAPQPAARAPAQPAPEIQAKKAWEVRWDEMVKAAQKEGKAVILNSAGGSVSTDLSKGFKKNFGIDLEFTTGRGADVVAKVLAERKSGLYIADIYIGGNTNILVNLKPAGALEPLEPNLILPELTDPELIKKTWFQGNLRWLDRDHYNLGFLASTPPPILINTNLVKYDEVKSLNNLLEPKWKGKIVLFDPMRPGFGAKWIGVLGSQMVGWDYVRNLSKQVTITADSRLLVEWVAQGKYPIGLAPQTAVVTEFIRAGAPLKVFVPVEGVHLTASSGSIALINKAPHPNAAKLFTNWILTKEGQTIYSQAFGQPSARMDVTTEGIDTDTIPDPARKYFLGDFEDFIMTEPENMRMARSIFLEGK